VIEEKEVVVETEEVVVEIAEVAVETVKKMIDVIEIDEDHEARKERSDDEADHVTKEAEVRTEVDEESPLLGADNHHHERKIGHLC